MNWKDKIKLGLAILLLVTFIGIFIYSLYKIVTWKIDNDKTNNLTVDILSDAEPKIYSDNSVKVTFDNVAVKNEDVIGWIMVNNTNVNYPVVQTSNNDYYLNHSFDKSINGAGWIFMDYRNHIDILDNNTIIFGHGRKDGSMFGSLRNIMEESWRNNDDNLNIAFTTLNESYVFRIFSAYNISDTDDYMKLNYDQAFLNKIIERSFFKFDTDVKEGDKILTLQTCYNDTKKLVIHAKLIEK